MFNLITKDCLSPDEWLYRTTQGDKESPVKIKIMKGYLAEDLEIRAATQTVPAL